MKKLFLFKLAMGPRFITIFVLFCFVQAHLSFAPQQAIKTNKLEFF